MIRAETAIIMSALASEYSHTVCTLFKEISDGVSLNGDVT
jgi:hypothetical protein